MDEWDVYLKRLPDYFPKLSGEADIRLVMPTEGVRVDQVVDTWSAPREGVSTLDKISSRRAVPVSTRLHLASFGASRSAS